MKHTKPKRIPLKNAVIKKPAFLRGISYSLIKWKESALADSSFFNSKIIVTNLQVYQCLLTHVNL